VYLAGDDGKLALDFAYPADGNFDSKKVVLMVPGVSGASTANYCLEAVFQLKKRGFTVCVINHIAPRGDV
jgi:predicted alpha/beta-fold hydrolase